MDVLLAAFLTLNCRKFHFTGFLLTDIERCVHGATSTCLVDTGRISSGIGISRCGIGYCFDFPLTILFPAGTRTTE